MKQITSLCQLSEYSQPFWWDATGSLTPIGRDLNRLEAMARYCDECDEAEDAFRAAFDELVEHCRRAWARHYAQGAS